MITKDLGAVSAYAYAVEKGYTGTEAEYAELMASYATVAQQASQSAQTAIKKAQQASASAMSASQSADTASASAQTAQTAQQTATTKASEAQQSAQIATTKAQEASQSASESSQSAQTAVQAKQDAESAKTASQTAQGLAESARDTAVSAKADAESARDDAETARDEAQQAVASISDALDDKAPVITDTASGSIASFSDGADDLPLKSLVIDINPVQDLHGQDSPYSAGGGKNLFDANTAVQGYCISNEDGELKAGDASYASDYIEVDAGQTYRISPTLSSGNWGAWYDENKAFISGLTGYATAKTAPSNAKYLRFTVSKNGSNPNYATTTQVEKGSEVTAWSPYENICPISGWTGANIVRTGKNLFDKTKTVRGFINDYNGELRDDGFPNVASDYIPVAPNQSYYIKSEQTKGAWGAWYDKDKNYISGITQYIATTSDINKTKTAPNNAHYMRLTVVYASNNEPSGNLDTFSVNYPATDHDYHPYTGRSITINLGQTVYGGKLDVTTGELVVDRAIIASYAGEILPSTWISDRDVYSEGATPTTGAQVCYELATPITYQLTPQEITSLLGTNNLWADTGDSEVEYRANTELWVQRKITEAVAAVLNS